MSVRLKSYIFAQALMRSAQAGGAAAYLVRRGDRDAGGLIVKVNSLSGTSRLYQAASDHTGARIWLPSAPMDEVQIKAVLAAQLSYDPDLWVIEIEDKAGRHFLTEPVAPIPDAL